MENIVFVADPGKALDDEEMMLVLSQLYRQGYANPVAVVANFAPAQKRAALMRGMLDLLGLDHVPVGIGYEVLDFSVQPDHELDEVPYLTLKNVHSDGQTLLTTVLQKAADSSLTLVLTSALTDAAQLLRDQQQQFVRAVKRVVIMGGVRTGADGVLLDERGHLLPDGATNNNYDCASAVFLYTRLQELGIPMVVVSRCAAHAAPVTSKLYQHMALSGHPVGAKLAHSYHHFIEDFWRAVNAPVGDRAHEALPARWNREHFLETFCGGRGEDRSATQSVHDLVQHSVLSDPMALIAAIPELCERFYAPCTVAVGSTAHQIIGISKSCTGIRDSEALAAFLVQQVLAALEPSPQQTANQ